MEISILGNCCVATQTIKIIFDFKNIIFLSEQFGAKIVILVLLKKVLINCQRMFINIWKKITENSARARLIRRCKFSETLDKYSQYLRAENLKSVWCTVSDKLKI